VFHLSLKSQRPILAVGVALLVLLAGAAEGKAAQVLPLPETRAPARLCSMLVSRAETCSIPLEGIDPPAQTNELNPGDTITAVITLVEKDERRTYWLLYLRVLDDHGEPPSKPASPMVLYSSRGTKLEFPSAPTRASLRTIGPFREVDAKKKPPAVRDQTDNFFLDKEFLGLGFDQAAAAIIRIRKVEAEGFMDFRDAPFDESNIQRGRRLAEAVQLADSEERALAGAIPALISYLDILQHTSGLEDVVSKIVARPSLWSIVRHRGVTASIGFKREQTDFAPEQGIFASSRYQLPLGMELNGQPALNVTLFVTAAQSPFLACGGVVGLLAEKPGDTATYLTIRVISARRAASKP
jgi:hypothetical protein